MDRTIFCVMLAGLLSAPGALALGGSDESLLSSSSPLPADLMDKGPISDVASDATTAIDGLVTCTKAVRVPIAILYGDVTDVRVHETTLPFVRTIEPVLAVEEIPIIGPITRTVTLPVGVGLDAVPQTVTETVMGVVGYDIETLTEERDIHLDVDLKWRQRYIDFDSIQYVVNVALPAGLPLVAVDKGELADVCDGSKIWAEVPTFRNEDGHAKWSVCIGCTDMDADAYDGWYTSVLRTATRFADSPHSAAALRDSQTWCPLNVYGYGVSAADAFAEGVEDGDTTIPSSPAAEEQAVAEATAAEAAAAAPAAAGGSSALASILGIAASGLGLVAYALRRK